MTVNRFLVPALLAAAVATSPIFGDPAADGESHGPRPVHEAAPYQERPDGPFIAVDRSAMPTSPGMRVTRGAITSVQVNVDNLGDNIVGDAANEPSIAVDPTNPDRMVIGWRQFDDVNNSFRQAGWAYTTDGGDTWTFPGSINSGEFRSDPVIGVDSQGVFYYYSLFVPGGGGNFNNDIFTSTDGGVSWSAAIDACGGDKAWLTVDRTGGAGDGHLYAFWTDTFSCSASGHFNRSTDGGLTFDTPINVPDRLQFGTLDVSANGDLFLGGVGNTGFSVVRSVNAQIAGQLVTFDTTTNVDLGGSLALGGGPNPSGLLGQTWIAIDPNNDNLYMLASVDTPGNDPVDVHFVRSTDGGATWSAPLRLNDDAAGTDAWQWFGTMSVAPNGRIDVVWNDTRNATSGFESELFYTFSIDGGLTWAPNVAATPGFDPLVGHPQQSKIGDYYHMVSTNDAAHLAFSATFNGEQDVYYARFGAVETIFGDGFESGNTSSWSSTIP